jgi:hypothetical protein
MRRVKEWIWVEDEETLLSLVERLRTAGAPLDLSLITFDVDCYDSQSTTVWWMRDETPDEEQTRLANEARSVENAERREKERLAELLAKHGLPEGY